MNLAIWLVVRGLLAWLSIFTGGMVSIFAFGFLMTEPGWAAMLWFLFGSYLIRLGFRMGEVRKGGKDAP